MERSDNIAGTLLERRNHIYVPPRNSLLYLNDDCLIEICKLLPFNDQIEFAYVCERFWGVCCEIFKIYKFLDLKRFDEMKLAHIRRILAVIGPHVVHIKMETGRFFHLLQEYFPNLEHLQLEWLFYVDIFHLELLQPVFKKLKILTLIDNSYTIIFDQIDEWDLSQRVEMAGVTFDNLQCLSYLNLRLTKIGVDDFCLLCKNANGIIGLDIHGSTKLRTKYILDIINENTPKLEYLVIDEFQSVLININRFKKLKSIKVIKCVRRYDEYSLPRNFLNGISEINLEELSFENCDIISIIRNDILKLKDLSKLSFINCEGAIDNFFSNYELEDNLNWTHFEFIKTPITDRGVLFLIDHAKYLKSISLFYTSVTDSLVFKVIELLTTHRPLQPLHLYALFTESILKDPSVVQNSDVLKLHSYESKMTYSFPV